MPISFNHTIVASRNKRESAEFLAELFGLPSPKPFGPFMAVALEHGATLDYADAPEGEEIRRQHYAFLVSEDDFDAIYGKITSRGLEHWADPGARRPGEINTRDGGRGVYFLDPSGHAMEILTRPYGSGR
ncbi:VOC family protein [Mycobacterium sp. 1081908.1]|uniref:VOC family protein n=1 Tax=Mycobacterium sp. 1081908.1 TaxID=1834066 RepID=UPI00080000BD|nr:VOC family protein [Mycobacterium sp. 1081908.1]OBK52551.1 bleomycin resistance protein [Mycobacterium sp. 1081908.1]